MRTIASHVLVPCIVVASCAAACGGEPETVRSAKARELHPAVLEADFNQQVRANTDFGLALMREVDSKDPNLIFSPHSISSALVMLYAGARGQTATDIAAALHYQLPNEKLHPMMNKLDLDLAARNKTLDDDDQFELRVANDLWLRKDFVVVPEYLDTIALNYGAGVRVLEFQKDPAGSLATINGWVEEQTKGRIKDLLDSNAVHADTQLVLTNTVYFKAKWESAFEKDATTSIIFTNIDGSGANVPMMRGAAHYGYTHADEYDAIELPYKGKELAMLIVMPKSGKLVEQQAALDAEKLAAIAGSLIATNIDLSMPKLEYTQEFDLKDALSAMGMGSAFNSADLSGLNATADLKIDAVKHKAFVLVDEEGTEAAAATGVSVGVTSLPAEPMRLIIDHPYFFFLRDVKTGAVLFVGRIESLASNALN